MPFIICIPPCSYFFLPKTPTAVVPMAIPIAPPRSSSSGYAAASMAKPTKRHRKQETAYKSDTE